MTDNANLNNQYRKILAATFSTPDGAGRAGAALDGAIPEGIDNTAVIVVRPDGKVKFVETKDWGAGRGALVGGLLGLIISPLGALTVGTLGAAAAKLRDSGFRTPELESLGHTLAPNSSAILVDLDANAADLASGIVLQLAPNKLVLTKLESHLASIFSDQDEPPPVA